MRKPISFKTPKFTTGQQEGNMVNHVFLLCNQKLNFITKAKSFKSFLCSFSFLPLSNSIVNKNLMYIV